MNRILLGNARSPALTGLLFLLYEPVCFYRQVTWIELIPVGFLDHVIEVFFGILNCYFRNFEFRGT